jgi:multidrug efflux system outer membrane protein
LPVRRGAAILIAVLLGGCTVGPDYVRPEVDAPDRWRFEDGESADLVNTRWWEQFGDAALNDLVTTALEHNKDVRIAAARIDEFASRVDITRAAFFPQIGYDGSATRDQLSRETAGGVPSGTDRTASTFAATINVGWELDVWGRIRRSTEAARAELLAAEEGRRTVILTLVSAVATSYVELRNLDQQLVIANRTLETRGESLRLFEIQRDGGVVSDLEVAQIESEYEQAAVRIPFIEREIALLENALSVLVGRNPGPIARDRTIDELILPVVPAGVPSDLLVRRPDIREAEQILVAANARIGVARAEYFPRISLTGVLGFASDDLSNLFRSSANVWSIGGNALGTIFAGGAIEGQVRATEAVQRQALVGYLLVIQTAFREVDDALISIEKSREELVAQGRRVEALREYARLAQLRYDNGYVSFIEVLDADRRLFDSELEYAQNQSNLYTSLVSVYKAMGGGWIVRAEEVANAVDFPPPPEDEEKSIFDFPEPTKPFAGARE